MKKHFLFLTISLLSAALLGWEWSISRWLICAALRGHPNGRRWPHGQCKVRRPLFPAREWFSPLLSAQWHMAMLQPFLNATCRTQSSFWCLLHTADITDFNGPPHQNTPYNSNKTLTTRFTNTGKFMTEPLSLYSLSKKKLLFRLCT